MNETRNQLVALRFTAAELERIDRQAAQEGRDRSGLIRWAIDQYLRERE